MNFSKHKNALKQYALFYLIGFLLILGIKYFYSHADSDQLIWILAPTTWWVSTLSGIPFAYESGIGYVNHSLRYIIAPSCSGVQFMIITMAMMFFSFVHRFSAPDGERPYSYSAIAKRSCTWMVASILFSYLFTVFVNGLRIIIAIYLPQFFDKRNLFNHLLTPERLHTLIGTVVYFISLLTIYHLLDYLMDSRSCNLCSVPKNVANTYLFHFSELQIQIIRKCLLPAFWYFFIVLGIPFLNSLTKKGHEQFLEYSILITLACVIILLLYYPLLQVKKRGV